MKHIGTLALILLLVGCGSAKISSEHQRYNEQRLAVAVQQKLDSRNYRIEVNYMIPLRTAAKVLTSPYSLKVKNDSIFSHLPYYGNAHSAGYGDLGGGGLVFDAPIKEYTDLGTKKDRHTIIIDVATSGDVLRYTLTVFDNGNTDINVSSRNRDDISYRGTLRFQDK
jgi:hypothetical protein